MAAANGLQHAVRQSRQRKWRPCKELLAMPPPFFVTRSDSGIRTPPVRHVQERIEGKRGNGTQSSEAQQDPDGLRSRGKVLD
jgi:hypothetical protein